MFLYQIRSSNRMFSVKKLFLEISQNSQENTRTRVSFLIKLQAFLGESFCQMVCFLFFLPQNEYSSSYQQTSRRYLKKFCLDFD